MLQHPTELHLGVRLIAGGIITITVLAIAPLRLGAREAVLPPVPPRSTWLPASGMPVPVLQPMVEKSAVEEPQHARPERPQRDEVRFVFMSDETTTMSGSSRDVERARSLRNRGERILWFMRDGKEYVVRDPEVLKQLQYLWGPVRRIGAEQGVIGAKQGELGAQQGRIGARQGRIGAEQGAVGARQAEIGARQAALAAREVRQASDRERVELHSERRELEKRMRELEREMAALSDRMGEEANPMAKLGAEMEVLGEEMSVLGKQMEEASRRAEAGMRNLMERAVANGTAQQVK